MLNLTNKPTTNKTILFPNTRRQRLVSVVVATQDYKRVSSPVVVRYNKRQKKAFQIALARKTNKKKVLSSFILAVARKHDATTQTTANKPSRAYQEQISSIDAFLKREGLDG